MSAVAAATVADMLDAIRQPEVRPSFAMTISPATMRERDRGDQPVPPTPAEPAAIARYVVHAMWKPPRPGDGRLVCRACPARPHGGGPDGKRTGPAAPRQENSPFRSDRAGWHNAPMPAKPTRPPYYLKQVSHRLRITRLALGKTAIELCREIDATDKAWSGWENGRRLFDVLAAIRLKKRHGITLDWIYGGDSSGLPARIAKLVREIERG